MKKTKRIKVLCVLLALFSVVPLLSIPTFASSPLSSAFDYSEQAKAVYLYSYDANSVLLSYGEEEVLSPGPSAKIVTGLIACERFSKNLDKTVLITEDMLRGVEGNSMNLRAGMTVTVKDLIYGTVCGGNNDTAQALAIVCEKSISSFVAKMNAYAASIYMKSTRFANPTGLDSVSARTTVKDIAILSRHAAENPLYMEISTAKSYEVKPLDGTPFTVYNRNALENQFSALGYLNSSANGIMAGKDDSGFFLCATAQSKDMKYLCVVMGAEADNEEIYSYYIANELLDYAFSHYSLKNIASKGDKLGELVVDLAFENGKEATLACVLAQDIYAFIPSESNVEKDLVYKVYYHTQEPKAPIEKGTVVGGVNVYYNGTLVASSKLISAQDVTHNKILLFLNRSKDVLTSRFSIIFICSFISVFILFLYLDRRDTKRRNVKVLASINRNR